MLVTRVEYIKNTNGKGYFKETEIERDYSGTEDRDGVLCVGRDFGDYPNCKNYCEAYEPL